MKIVSCVELSSRAFKFLPHVLIAIYRELGVTRREAEEQDDQLVI